MQCCQVIRSILAVAIAACAVVVAVGCSSSAEHSVVPGPTDVHAAPTHVRWVGFQGVQVPVGDQGPHRIEGPIAIGYDRSPAGAGLAAIESTIRMSIADDNQWPQVGRQLLVPGVARDRWATGRVQFSVVGPVPAGAAPHVLGYAITGYSAARAEVAIYTRQSDGSLTRNATTVVRSGDTWLLDLSATSGTPPIAAVLHLPADMVHLPASPEEPTR